MIYFYDIILNDSIETMFVLYSYMMFTIFSVILVMYIMLFSVFTVS